MGERIKAVSREELLGLMQLCENIERQGIDPFTVNVRQLLLRLRSLLDKARHLEEIVLDAETIYRIALLIAFQSKWLKQRASTLFIDHQLVALKLAIGTPRELAASFLKAWTPIVRLEQVNPYMLKIGMEHFLALPTLSTGKYSLPGKEDAYLTEFERLVKEGIIDKTWFEDMTKKLYVELDEAASVEGYVDYWSFVTAESFEETVDRAYILSFLVSTGLVDIEVDPVTGGKKLRPLKTSKERKTIFSLVTNIDVESYRARLDERLKR